MLDQCNAMYRYLGKTIPGPNGEVLYPTNDAEKAYFIDLRLKADNALLIEYNRFFLDNAMINPDHANAEEHFFNFI